jgi:hypothetical protein
MIVIKIKSAHFWWPKVNNLGKLNDFKEQVITLAVAADNIGSSQILLDVTLKVLQQHCLQAS